MTDDTNCIGHYVWRYAMSDSYIAAYLKIITSAIAESYNLNAIGPNTHKNTPNVMLNVKRWQKYILERNNYTFHYIKWIG